MSDVIINITLSEELRTALKMYALSQKKTMNQTVVDLIENASKNYLEK